MDSQKYNTSTVLSNQSSKQEKNKWQKKLLSFLLNTLPIIQFHHES
jgi:hypothetical protein